MLDLELTRRLWLRAVGKPLLHILACTALVTLAAFAIAPQLATEASAVLANTLGLVGVPRSLLVVVVLQPIKVTPVLRVVTFTDLVFEPQLA